MKKKIKMEIGEWMQKCRTWIDNEEYLPATFRKKSYNDNFAEKIIEGIDKIMEIEKFHFHKTKIIIPTIYNIFLSQEDNAKWYGIKREFLIKKLDAYVEERLKMVSVETIRKNFVHIFVSNELRSGTVHIRHQWEESDLPIGIHFNYFPSQSESYKNDFFQAEESALIENQNSLKLSEDEFEMLTKTGSNKEFSLEIRRDNFFHKLIPIYQPEISLGRSSKNTGVDIVLLNDLEISRHHATLRKKSDSVFSLFVTGQNPVYVEGNCIEKGQKANCLMGETINIGSYFLTLSSE